LLATKLVAIVWTDSALDLDVFAMLITHLLRNSFVFTPFTDARSFRLAFVSFLKIHRGPSPVIRCTVVLPLTLFVLV
jgi:hypothetical protein